MGIFDRLATLLKSNINDLISSAENPEKMLNQIIVDMREQMVKAKQQVAAAIADEKRLHDQAQAEFKLAQDWEQRAMLAVQQGRDDLAKQALVRQSEHFAHAQQLDATWQQHRLETEKLKNALRDLNDKVEEAKLAQDWEQRAMLAVQQGRDDLARQALMRQSEHATHAQALEATWQQHRLETEKLKASLRDLNDKIEEAKRKKNLLLARQRRAEAQKRIAETMSGLSEKSAFEAFARMEEKIEQNERMIKASGEIDEEFSGDTLARDFKRLERTAGSASADQQLLALKQKMGMLPASSSPQSKQLGAGQSTAPSARDDETVHAEIEDLHDEK